MEKQEKQIQRMLRQLSMTGSYLGFYYLSHGLQLIIGNPMLILHVCKGLYVDIASNFNTSIECVERDIRTVKIHTMKYGDRELINEIFGDGKEIPSNSEFIDALYQYALDTIIIK